LNFGLILRRLGLTLVLAFLLFGLMVCVIDQQVATILFLLSWVVLFFGWPDLSRKLGFDFPKAPAPRKPRQTAWARILITGVLAFVVGCALSVLADPSFFGLSIFLWLGLYYGWPLLSRRLTFLNFLDLKPRPLAPRRPLWLRLVRGTAAWVGGITLTLIAFCSLSLAPLFLCHWRAQRVHDSVRIGMTVPEVLHTVKDCDIFNASSDFPHDDNADSDNIPAISLRWSQNGTYHTYDLATHRTLDLSESEALDRLHDRLHDGYRWSFHYTYINMTPQHVSFSVVFGPDGRVTEVRPVYGWD